MFKNAAACIVLGLSIFGAICCFADDAVSDSAASKDGVVLKRVELFPAGQGVFEYESVDVGDADLMLTLTRNELDDLLKSLVLKGFDTARVDYETNADRNNMISQIVSSGKITTRSELLQGMKGHAIQLTDARGSMSGVIVAVELQSNQEKSGQDVEVITLRTAEGIEQRVLSESTKFKLDDKAAQSQMDQALKDIAKPKTTRTPVTLRLKKKERGLGGLAFQTETAAWKCSYRIAKIEGEYQLVVSAVIDNNTGIDWIDVEMVLIVDQPLGFHSPLSTVHRTQRTFLPIPSAFSAAPPSLAAGVKRKQEQLIADEPSQVSREGLGGGYAGMGGYDGYGGGKGGGGYGGIGGGGYGGMGGSMGGKGGSMGGMEGGYGEFTTPQTEGDSTELEGDHQGVASRFGMSFPIGDLSHGLAGQRVRIRLPHVSIRAGESESIFLPAIPKNIEDVRVYVASISGKYPLSAFQITLQDGYQLPGGPGTVWSETGYAGDVMLPRLVAQVPQLVTYALDTSIEVSSHIQPGISTKSTYQFDEVDTLIATNVSERRVRYTIVNEGNDLRAVSIEHRPSEKNWLPVPTEEQAEKPADSNYRYDVICPKKSTVTHDVLETKTTIVSWKKETNWVQLKQLTLDAEMPLEIRERLVNRIEKLAEYEALQGDELKLTQSTEKAASEQFRIKSLMVALNREDELQKRYLKKLADLENEIESASEKLLTVRKKLEDARSRLNRDALK